MVHGPVQALSSSGLAMRHGILNRLRLSPLHFHSNSLLLSTTASIVICQSSSVIDRRSSMTPMPHVTRPPEAGGCRTSCADFFFDRQCMCNYPPWTSMHRCFAYRCLPMLKALSDLEVIQYPAYSFSERGGVKMGWGRRLGTCMAHCHAVNGQFATLHQILNHITYQQVITR